MLGPIGAVLSRLSTELAGGGFVGRTLCGQPSSDDDTVPTDPAADDAVNAASPHLFECRSCGRVYVATDKHACATCDTAVHRVDRAD